MRSFLFDILPETGHVRMTLCLALLLNKKGHEVYYTDTSDSVFTSELLRKGIGRVIYPDDFRWFEPDVVLLDLQLRNKAYFYKQCDIYFVYVVVHSLGDVQEKMDAPVIYLSPSAYTVTATSNRMPFLMELMPEWKGDPERVVIVGLLEEEPYSHSMQQFYEILRNRCLANTNYQLILLTNSRETVERLFPLPDNMTLYRLLDLPTLLPYCDVALTTGKLNTLIECIHANLPAVTYPVSGEAVALDYAREYVKLGLGICGEIQQITPEIFEQQITEIMNNKEQMQERSRRLRETFDKENEKLEKVANRLISMTQKRHK